MAVFKADKDFCFPFFFCSMKFSLIQIYRTSISLLTCYSFAGLEKKSPVLDAALLRLLGWFRTLA